MKSQIKTAKMKLPLHEFPFVKATAPSFGIAPCNRIITKAASSSYTIFRADRLTKADRCLIVRIEIRDLAENNRIGEMSI